MATSNAPFRGMLDTNVTCDISLSVVTQGGVRVFFIQEDVVICGETAQSHCSEVLHY